MKWYEKQKKLFEEQSQKNVPVEPQENEEKTPLQNGENMMADPTANWEKEKETENESELKTEEKHTMYNEDDHAETTIGKDAILQGDLSLKGNLHLSGTIKGNIICDGDVHIDGAVEGNISAANIYLKHADIHGDIECSGAMDMILGSIINGNIHCVNLQCSGVINGNALVDEEVTLQADAQVSGDMQAHYLTAEKGAALQGQCKIVSR